MATPLTDEHRSHIFRRMGFGGAPDDLAQLPGTREDAVNYMIDYDRIDNSAMETALTASFDFSAPLNNTKINQQEIRRRFDALRDQEIRRWPIPSRKGDAHRAR